MINDKSNPVAWALLISELDEAREHLESLINEMIEDKEIEEDTFAVCLGHVYAHVNRVWNSRNLDAEISEAEWEQYSSFPNDIEPVG